MNDTDIFIAGMVVGCLLCYFAGLLKGNSVTNIKFVIDAEGVKLQEVKAIKN